MNHVRMLSASLRYVLPALAATLALSVSAADDPEPARVPSAAAPGAEVADPPGASCLRASGSRIPVPKGRCVPGVTGRVYREDDIRATGAPTADAALRQLDPTVILGPGR